MLDMEEKPATDLGPQTHSTGNGQPVCIGGYTTAGAKPVNQDAFAAYNPSDTQQLQDHGITACVADGLSNAPQAAEASQLAVQQFVDDYYAASPTWTASEAMTRSLTALNTWLNSQSLSAQGAMATTFTGLVVRGRTAHFCQIGDSSAWLFREGRLQKITQDHSMSLLGGETILTAALGADPLLSVRFETVELVQHDLIILMTDGITSVLQEAVLQDWLQARDTSSDLEALSMALCHEAEGKGANDNLTALCIRIDQFPAANLSDGRSSLLSRTFLPDLETGQSVDGYMVERVLHKGVRSAVYLVTNKADGERYVLKAPTAIFADDTGFLDALAREEWIGQKIGSDRIVRTYPTNRSSFIYLLTEYVPGQTLRQWIIDHPKPDLPRVREMLDEMVQAVRTIQRQQVVHRDLKPENLMVTPEGRIKIIDFGSASVAGLNETSATIADWQGEGSLNYSAPEYILGDPATAAADLFSVACIVYEMLCGELPFTKNLAANRIPSNLSAWRYIPIVRRRDDLPDFVDAALESALRPDPRTRTSALSEFLTDMTRPGALALRRSQSKALIERDPLKFWQLVCLVQFVIIFILYVQLIG